MTKLISPSAKEDSSSSIYAAFRLARLVNSFHRRIKTRVFSRRGGNKKALPKAVQEEFCHDFEKEAAQEIDRYLGGKQHRHWNKGVTKVKSESRCLPPKATYGAAAGAETTQLNIEPVEK